MFSRSCTRPVTAMAISAGTNVMERTKAAAKARITVSAIDVPADGIDAGHARHALELRPDDPVLHRAQVGGALELARERLAFRREIGSVALPARLSVAQVAALPRLKSDCPHIDFAETRRNRTD